jgi:two-component system, OmpR family, alkaline phosphatase synthesis response regulator PhoP
VNGKKIVVADDEAHIRHIVSMKLHNAGFHVLTAADGEEAWDLCLSESPDLLITDFQMPLLSGLDLCKRLRQDERTRGVLSIMLTARGFNLDPAEMAGSGIMTVMSKPFSPRELLEKVKEVISAPEAVEQPGR